MTARWKSLPPWPSRSRWARPEPGRHIGPVVNKRQWDQIQGYIQKGIDEGARLVAGGLGRPDGLNRGFYVRPTVFADVTPGMTIEREEIFGPVLSIIPFDTEAEAVAIANNTPYGLTNYVQSQDGARRNRLARALRSGMVEMNGKSRGAGAPFGGVKASGRAREGGHWGLEEFLEVKAISGWDWRKTLPPNSRAVAGRARPKVAGRAPILPPFSVQKYPRRRLLPRLQVLPPITTRSKKLTTPLTALLKAGLKHVGVTSEAYPRAREPRNHPCRWQDGPGVDPAPPDRRSTSCRQNPHQSRRQHPQLQFVQSNRLGR